MFNKEQVSCGLIFPSFWNFQCYPQDMSLLSFLKIILQEVHLKHYQFYSILFISTNNCHCESDWRLVIGIYFLRIISRAMSFNWQVYHMLPCPYVAQTQTLAWRNSESNRRDRRPGWAPFARWMKMKKAFQMEGTAKCCSVTQSCPTLYDPMDCSTPGLPVLHHLPELAQTHVHWVSDAIQPSHPLSSSSLPAFNLSQHQGLF